METGSKKLVILSYAIVCFHPSVSLNNEKICCAISEDKIAVCEKTAGLRSGNFSDLNSACQKVVVPVKIFQFQDMLNENRFLDTFRGHSKRTMSVIHFCLNNSTDFGGGYIMTVLNNATCQTICISLFIKLKIA